VFLRPVWFMENFLWNIGLIKTAGINGLAFRPDVSFPMIAAADIAPVAVEYLTSLAFEGRNVRYLMGPREYTMVEVTRTLGAAIGKPDLRYIEFPDAVFRKGLIGSGGLTGRRNTTLRPGASPSSASRRRQPAIPPVPLSSSAPQLLVNTTCPTRASLTAAAMLSAFSYWSTFTSGA
jgi:uncharacterized protein YbjT (DUF2867 family)